MKTHGTQVHLWTPNWSLWLPSITSQVLTQLRCQSVNYFWCDARESAIGFYRRFGMQAEGERFYKGDIPYFRMGLRV